MEDQEEDLSETQKTKSRKKREPKKKVIFQIRHISFK